MESENVVFASHLRMSRYHEGMVTLAQLKAQIIETSEALVNTGNQALFALDDCPFNERDLLSPGFLRSKKLADIRRLLAKAFDYNRASQHSKAAIESTETRIRALARMLRPKSLREMYLEISKSTTVGATLQELIKLDLLPPQGEKSVYPNKGRVARKSASRRPSKHRGHPMAARRKVVQIS